MENGVTANPDWNIVMTRAGDEAEVAGDFLSAGYTVYLPLLRYMTKPKGKRKPVEIKKPAYPGYFFAAGNGSRVSTKNYRFMAHGNVLCTCPDSHLNGIRELTETLIFGKEPQRIFAEGDKISVIAGPFQGRAGVVANSGLKLRILLDDFSSKVSIPAFLVERV